MLLGGIYMLHLAVVEEKGTRLAEKIGGKFASQNRGQSLRVTRANCLSELKSSFDLLVIAGEKLAPPVEKKVQVYSRAVLVPDASPRELFAHIHSKWAVSFGLSSKASITLSSIEPETAMLALQRELVTLENKVLEQQEIPLKLDGKSTATQALALYGALLLLGLSP